MIFAAVFTVSGLVASYAIIMPILIFRVSVTVTEVLESYLDDDGLQTIGRKNRYGILFWLIVDAVIAALVVLFVPKLYIYAVIGGVVFCLLLGLGKTGRNAVNMFEFYKTNVQYISEENQEEFRSLIAEMTDT